MRTAIFLALLLISGPLLAEEGAYGALSAGAVIWPDRSNSNELEADADPGPVAALALGYAFTHLRMEAEAAFRASKVHGLNGDAATDTSCAPHCAAGGWLYAGSLMLNAWPRARLGAFELYAGGGAGGALLTYRGDYELTPAWQVGGGLAFALGEQWLLDVGYRYQRTLEAELGNADARYDTHGLLVGLRFGW